MGAGQLGRMLQQSASTLGIQLHFLDKDDNFPAAQLSRKFTKGDFKDYDNVLKFGQDKDVITIEIENVNTEALKKLESQGIKVFPQANVIETIKDKGLQKQFYDQENIPTSPFKLYDTKEDILDAVNQGQLAIPFVQKSRLAGYDGKGVSVIKTIDDLKTKLISAPSVVEDLVDIQKEIAIIVARNQNNDVTFFEPTEMVFNQDGNLLDYLISPGQIDRKYKDTGKKLAEDIIKKLDMVGILAVEMFIDNNGALMVNEVAPRTHNSGHHTINACNVSQFDIHLRTITNLPLPNIQAKSSYSAIINLLGASDTKVGFPTYENINEILDLENVYVHIYGKDIVKPLRKMGHVNVLADSMEELSTKINFIKSKIKIHHV